MARDEWKMKLIGWYTCQLVFLDKSSSNIKTEDRKYGWAPVGKTAILNWHLKYKYCYNILLVYSYKGYMTEMVKEGSINKEKFNTFIQTQILSLIHLFPEKKSVLIMDNNFTYYSKIITNKYLYMR